MMGQLRFLAMLRFPRCMRHRGTGRERRWAAQETRGQLRSAFLTWQGWTLPLLPRQVCILFFSQARPHEHPGQVLGQGDPVTLCFVSMLNHRLSHAKQYRKRIQEQAIQKLLNDDSARLLSASKVIDLQS